MPADLNVLYSTIATCSAAIVAIIGGLIAATLLQLSADRNGTLARMAERRQELASLEQEKKRSEEAQDRMRALYLLRERLDDLLDLPELPPAGEAREFLDARYVPIEVFREEWDATVKAITAEKAQLEKDVQAHGDSQTDFNQWVTDNHIDMAGRSEWLAERIFYHRRGVRLGESESDHDRDDQDWHRRVGGFEDLINEIERRMTMSQSELELLNDRLRSGRQPGHVVLGVLVLFVLTVTGVVLPILLIGVVPPVVSLDRQWVIGGFLVGLLLVFAFFVILILELKMPKNSVLLK